MEPFYKKNMGKYYALLICTMLFCCSCIRSKFDRFNKKILSAAEDGKINQSEFRELLSLASNKSVFSNFYPNGTLDTLTAAQYVSKYLRAKGISLTPGQIWSSEASVQREKKIFNVNVYLENSASMDGYVSKNTEFKDGIYSLLGNLSLSKFCDSLNLNYINNTVHPTEKNAGVEGIRDFISTLTPGTFRQKGGIRSSSELRNVIDAVLNRTNDGNASILISDFVFSPGIKVNAHDYLTNQSIGIQVDLAKKLKKFDLAVEILQLTSTFEGSYYDEFDRPVKIDCKRPYYIWIIGSSEQLKKIIESKLLENIRGGYQNKLIVEKIRNVYSPNYKVLYGNKIGSFRLLNGAKGPLSEAAASSQPRTQGLFAFHVAVDYSGSIQGQAFFSDSTNFTIDPGFNLSVTSITDTANLSLNGFTHELKLSTKNLRRGTFNIAVKGQTPGWVASYSSENDQLIDKSNREKQCTFGLNYLIEGLYNAFYQNPEDNTISKLSIVIK
jgi:hypothetical protein